MHTIFIYNTQSGKGISISKLKKIISYLTSSFPTIVLCPTKRQGDAKNYTLKYLKSVNIIFILGGDGTIHDVISAIIPSTYSPKLCIIPNGTMNDLSHSLNIPKNYKKAISLSLSKNYKHFNAIKINDKYAIYATAIGRFSSTSYTSNQTLKNILGRLSYYLYALKDLFRYKPITAKIVIDGKNFDGCYSLILTCIHKYIAGYNIGKNTKFKTGKCILIKESPDKKYCTLKNCKNIAKFFIKGIDKNLKNPNIQILDFKNINISINPSIPMVLDGEKYENSNYDISIINNAIRIFSEP